MNIRPPKIYFQQDFFLDKKWDFNLVKSLAESWLYKKYNVAEIPIIDGMARLTCNKNGWFCNGVKVKKMTFLYA